MPSFLSLIHSEMPKLPSTQTLPDTAVPWNFISMTEAISAPQKYSHMHLTSLVLIDCRMRSDLSMCFTSLLLEQRRRSEIIFIWKIHRTTRRSHRQDATVFLWAHSAMTPSL